MTKLPQSLEKEIKENSEEWHNKWMDDGMPPIHVKKVHQTGATDIALAVLEKAEKLAEALDKVTTFAEHLCEDVRVSKHWNSINNARIALAEWREFKGES